MSFDLQLMSEERKWGDASFLPIPQDRLLHPPSDANEAVCSVACEDYYVVAEQLAQRSLSRSSARQPRVAVTMKDSRSSGITSLLQVGAGCVGGALLGSVIPVVGTVKGLLMGCAVALAACNQDTALSPPTPDANNLPPQDLSVTPRDMPLSDLACASEPVAPLPDLLFLTPRFEDEFNGNALDVIKWFSLGNKPVVANGQITLTGTLMPPVRSEIQSIPNFQYGVVAMKITALNGWPEKTDSSFGFEIFYPNQCHDVVHMVADGNLGVLQSEPVKGDCSQQSQGIPNRLPSDPKYQHYEPISNWCKLRQSKTLFFTLTWRANGVSLEVSDGMGTRGEAAYPGPRIPSVPMKIRLNSDYNDKFLIDSVRVYR